MSELQRESASIGTWREGYRLVVLKGALLPCACVKCGVAVAGPGIRKTYYWAPTSFFRFIPFPGSLIAVIIALVIRKKMTVEIPLCPAHRRRRAVGIILTGLFGGGGLSAIGLGLTWAISTNGADADNAPVVIGTGIGLLLIGVLCFVFAGRLLSPKQIDADQATFTGAGARFLQLLPTSPNLKL